MLGALGTYLPTKEKVANSFRIRDALQTAAEMRPADGSVQLALGEWCFKVRSAAAGQGRERGRASSSPWRVARRCPDTLSQSGHPLGPHSDPAGGWHRLGRGERREAAVWAGARVDVRRGALETLDADRASWYSGEHSRPHLVARARPRGAGVQCTRLCYSRAVCSLTSGARLLRAGLGAQAEQEGGEWPRGKGRRLESGRERWGCGAHAPPPSHCGDRHPISGRVQGEPRLRQALARRRLGGLAHACARAARRRRGRR